MNYVSTVWNLVPAFVVKLFNSPTSNVKSPRARRANQLRQLDLVDLRLIQDRLHAAYVNAGKKGLTDFEACRYADVSFSADRTCSLMRRLKIIVATGRRRAGKRGRTRMVCVLAEFCQKNG